MGRAARWLRQILGGKKTAEGAVPLENRPAKEKKRWGFVKSYRERLPPAAVSSEYLVSQGRKGSYREETGSPATPGSLVDGDEQNKRAIAVAAATAAVAEAAVAAAQAAAAVVRLTSSTRSVGFGAAVATKREERAAVEIQAAFRGYLARRALRALKGLVKLQALVRGNIVRKQAAETLRCMQALVRVQARARACRALRSEPSRSSKSSRSYPGPPTPGKYEPAKQVERSTSLKRNSSKQARIELVKKKSSSANWNWLDQWMEDEKNAKILEVDTGKPSKRRGYHHLQSLSSSMNSDQNCHGLSVLPDSPSKDSTTAQLSAPSPSSPLRFHVEPGDYGESPQFFSAVSRPGSSRRGAFTPVKSECSRSILSGFSDCPNYMANTESSRAKARSQSAPKQRPEFEKSSSLKRFSAQGFAAPALPSETSGQRSLMHSKFANKAYPGSGRLDRLGLPMRI